VSPRKVEFEDKKLFAISHIETMQESFEVMKLLHKLISELEDKKKILFRPPDQRGDKNVEDAFSCIKDGYVWWGDIAYPESLLYKIFQMRSKISFSSQIAAVLTFWNQSIKCLKQGL